MNHFLQNLIGRHQDVGVSQAGSQLVQPRPKAKFEIDARPVFIAQNDSNNGFDFTAVVQADTDIGLYASPHDQETKPIMSAESKQSSRHTQVFPQQNFDELSAQHDFNRHIDHLNESTKIMPHPSGQKSSVQETSVSTSKTESYKQTDSLHELPEITNQANHRQLSSLDEINHHIQKTFKHLNNQHPQHADDQRFNESLGKPASDADNHTLSSEINHRIQTMLRRLISEQPRHADGQRTNESQRDLAFDEDNNAAASEANQRIQAILHRLSSQQSQNPDELRVSKSQHEPASNADNNALTNTVQSPSIVLPPEFVQPVIKVIKQREESQSEQRKSRQQGSLQIPNWLHEMQTNLNNRMQEINTKAQPEPVINVTIGRIEVKAIQAESVKQPKVRNKPSTVMGLDDYLKQRESRGRV